ncbi:hypothetical protein SDC9_158584 [bioreactor metagenome]|uniref:Uncharacterized protein n=1 Tax=bioreactor metagenome TaxID=1076179 RepID=A0A645FFY8_9ZZZZ
MQHAQMSQGHVASRSARSHLNLTCNRHVCQLAYGLEPDRGNICVYLPAVDGSFRPMKAVNRKGGLLIDLCWHFEGKGSFLPFHSNVCPGQRYGSSRHERCVLLEEELHHVARFPFNSNVLCTRFLLQTEAGLRCLIGHGCRQGNLTAVRRDRFLINNHISGASGNHKQGRGCPQ